MAQQRWTPPSRIAPPKKGGSTGFADGPSFSSSGAPSFASAPTFAPQGGAGLPLTSALAAAARANKRAYPLGFLKSLATPFEAALDYVSQPVYAVGNTIEGDIDNAAKNLLNAFVPGTQFSSTLAGDRTLPSEGLSKYGVLDGNQWWNVPLRIGLDIGLDPATYVSFGTAGAAKAAAANAARLARNEATRISMAKAMSSATNVADRLAMRDAAASVIRGVNPAQATRVTYGPPTKAQARAQRADEAVRAVIDNAYQRTFVEAEAATAYADTLQGIKSAGDQKVTSLNVNIPFKNLASMVTGGKVGRGPARTWDLPRNQRLSNITEKYRDLASPELKYLEQAAKSDDGMMRAAARAGMDKWTTAGGLSRGVHAAIVQAGHQNNRIDDMSTRAAEGWLRDLAERGQRIGVKPKDVDRVAYAITVATELPKIAGRLFRKTYGVEPPANLSDVWLRDAYIQMAEQIKKKYGVEIISREDVAMHFSDDVSRMRKTLDQIDDAEMKAGIIRGQVDDYVPHYWAVMGRNSRQVLRKVKKGANRVSVNPLSMSDSVKNRKMNDLLDWLDEDLIPELSAPEIVRLRQRESGRLLTKRAGDDALAARYGISKEMSGTAEMAESRFAELQQRYAQLVAEYNTLASRRATSKERAEAYARVVEAHSDLREAEALRPYNMTPDSPMTSPRLPNVIADAEERAKIARDMRASDDPKVRDQIAELDATKAAWDREVAATEGIMQTEKGREQLARLQQIENDTFEAYKAANAAKYSDAEKARRMEQAQKAAETVARVTTLRENIKALLDDVLTDSAWVQEDDLAKLQRLETQLAKAETRMESLLNLKWDSSIDDLDAARADVNSQLQILERAEDVVIAVFERAEKELARAEKRVTDASLSATRRIAGRQARANSTVRRLRATTRDTERTAQARRELQAAQSAHRRLQAASREYVGYAVNFRRIGREMEQTAQKMRKAEQQLAKAAERERRALLTPARPVNGEEWGKALADNWQTLADKAHYEFTLVPPEIRAAAERSWGMVFGELRTPGDFHGLWVFLQNATTIWKRLALATPGYVIRNGLSDLMMMYVGGFRDPIALKQAAGIVNKTGKIPGTDLTYEQIRLELDAGGLRQVGFAGAEVGRSSRRVGKKWYAWSVPGRGRFASGLQQINENRENLVRAAMYLEGRKMGMPIEEARDRTLKWLFDYADVAPAIESLRRILVPFIVYPTKAIPAISGAMVRTPGFFANYASFVENMNRAAGYPDLSTVPAWSAGSFALPDFMAQPLSAVLGNESNSPILFNPANTLPWGSVNTFLSTKGLGSGENENPFYGLTGVAASVAGQMNPAVGAAFRGFGWMDPLTGRQPSDLSRAPFFLSWIPGLPEKQSSYAPEGSFPAIPRPLGAILGMVPTIGQADTYVGTFAGNAGIGDDLEKARWDVVRKGFGLNFTPYDLAKARYLADKYGR